MELKLPKLPNRTPIKITIALKPALNVALQAYAEIYRETYGESETVAELIPYMLQSFLDGDRNFAKVFKTKESGDGQAASTAPTRSPRPRQRPEIRRRIRKLQTEEAEMSVIGRFTPNKEGGWIGTIRTLTIDVKARFVPNDNRDNEHAPAFRIFAGTSELGAAWRQHTSGENPREYLSVRLDDPSLPDGISAALFEVEDESAAHLVWNRRRSE